MPDKSKKSATIEDLIRVIVNSWLGPDPTHELTPEEEAQALELLREFEQNRNKRKHTINNAETVIPRDQWEDAARYE